MTANRIDRYEANFMSLRGADWSKLSRNKRTRMVERAFRFWRKHGFPYYRLSSQQIRQELLTLLNKDEAAVFVGDDLRSSNAGLRLANSFQPGMWNARVNRYLSPMQVFKDDNLFRRAIRRSFSIWPDRFGASASCIRRILRTYPGAASVSNYRPMIAKAIMATYSSAGDTVVDFSAGYGGRLLGAIASRRNYVGIEPNRAQVRGFLRMSRAICREGFETPTLTLLLGTAETRFSEVSSSSAGLVYSSPPFFDWEHYSKSKQQSFRRYPTYQIWLDRFLKPAIAESFRSLRRKGYLALNATNGNRLPIREDVEEIARHVGFKALYAQHEMVFPKVPYLHPRGTGPVKRELILVFRKT